MPTVNTEHTEPGCFIDGHHGQYAPDQVAEVCEDFEIAFEVDNDPRWWRKMAEAIEAGEFGHLPYGSRRMTAEDCWEMHVAASDVLYDRLNEVTTGGHWEWVDGELFLTQTEVTGVVYVAADEDDGTKRDYDEAWNLLVQHGPDVALMGYDDLPHGENFFEFRITVHYEP